MTAAGSVDLAIEGDNARAVRVPRHTYRNDMPKVVDLWCLNAPTALPPYAQFTISATGYGPAGYLFRVGAISPDGEALNPAAGPGNGVHIMPAPIASHTFHGDDQTARDLCLMIAQGLVNGRLHLTMSPAAWELVLAATVNLAGQVRAEQAGTTLSPPGPLPDWERDDLRERLADMYAALDEADPVKYPEPASAVQRIRALGDRARQITDMLAGASERLARHDAAPAKFDTPVGIFMAGTRGIGGTIGVLRDVAAERQRAEAEFPDQHLPDGTDEAYRTDADESRAAVDAALRNGRLAWLDIITEEYDEARAETDPVKLRAELVQVAAVAVRWVEDIDLRAAEQADAA